MASFYLPIEEAKLVRRMVYRFQVPPWTKRGFTRRAYLVIFSGGR